MSNAAAPIARPTARFLAIGTPAAPDKASAGAFATVLADKTADTIEPGQRQSGKALPKDRQDLAASRRIKAADGADGEAPEADADTRDKSEDDEPALAATPVPVSQPIPVEPVAPMRTNPPVDGAVDPVILAPLPTEGATTGPVQPRGLVAEIPPVAEIDPVAPTIVEPKPAHAVAFVLRAAPAPAADSAIPAPAAATAPAAAEPDSVDAASGRTIATATMAIPTVPAAPASIVATATQTPAAEMPAKAEAVPLAEKPGAAAPDDVRTRFAHQPMIEARAVATAARTEAAIDAAPVKPRARAVTSTLAELTGISSTTPIDVRAVTAASAAAGVQSLPQDRAVAMMETIQALRSEMRGDGLDLSIDHKEYGPISVRFDRAEDGVSVRFTARDAEAARAIAEAAPQFKNTADLSGLRFERRDTLGANAGGSQDAPRQGRDRTGTQISSNPLPQARETRDDSGIFA